MSNHNLTAETTIQQTLDTIQTGKNVIVSLKPGAPRRELIEHILGSKIAANQRIIYISPYKHVLSTHQQRWRRLLPQARIELFTDLYDPSKHAGAAKRRESAQILLYSPEKLAKSLYYQREAADGIQTIIVDGLDFLNHAGRGVHLELALSQLRFQRTTPIQIIALSSTPHVQEAAQWLEADICLNDRHPDCFSVNCDTEINRRTALITHLKNMSPDSNALIIVGSRKRASDIASFLRRKGISAAEGHPGMDKKQIAAIQAHFQDNSLKAIVCTAHFPVLYDLTATNCLFYDLQAGQNDEHKVDSYTLNDLILRCEQTTIFKTTSQPEISWQAPTLQSQLFQPAVFQQHLLYQLARGEQHTELLTGASFAARLGTLADVDQALNELRQQGLIATNEDSNLIDATDLGQLAAVHYLSPRTVARLDTIIQNSPSLAWTDLLLLAASTIEFQHYITATMPRHRTLAQDLNKMHSTFLQGNAHDLATSLELSGSQMLQSINTACVIRQYINHTKEADLMRRYNTPPKAIEAILGTSGRIMLALAQIAERHAFPLERSTTAAKARTLYALLNGIPFNALSLAYATLDLAVLNRLVKGKIYSLGQLVQLHPSVLQSPNAEAILQKARELLATHPEAYYAAQSHVENIPEIRASEQLLQSLISMPPTVKAA